MTKVKTISLLPAFNLDGKVMPNDPNAKGFRVVKITDSLEFEPGQFLFKQQVQELCEAKDWKVTIANKS